MTGVLRLAFKVSRIRFWLYLGGTFLVGYIVGMSSIDQLIDPFFIASLFYFMIPANIFLYGVNDLSDKDTDLFNPKKDEKEYRAVESDQKKLQGIVFLSFVYGIVLIVFAADIIYTLLFSLWILLSVFYSAKPFRFKAVPVLDFTSNFLYVVPALIAYYQITGIVPPFLPLFAAFLWTAAMQLFSAIPDIAADAKAGIRTTAVVLGKRTSLVLTLVFWLGFSLILVVLSPWNLPWSILMFSYPMIPLVLLLKPTVSIDRAYWMFPYWTGIFGMVLFMSIGIPKVIPL